MSIRESGSVVALVLTVCVTFSAGMVQTAAAQSPDIVLYSSDVSVIGGNWSRAQSTTGAAGLKMTSEDRGWSSRSAPLAVPEDYFEAEFEAQANLSYRLWMRLRAAWSTGDNDSVWVQFSGASDADGAPLWQIGTDSALLVNLEDCSGCAVSGWGWQDNSWWLEQSSIVRFQTRGRQKIRVQTREDGVDVDQIVLSAGPYLSVAPGAVKDDTVVVSKSAGYSTLVRAPYLQEVSDSSAVVVWTTREAGVAEVRYGPAGAWSASVVADTRLFRASETGLPFDFYQHEARLFSLAPASRYTYDVFLSGFDLTGGQDMFSTAPSTGSGTVRFIVFGDSGIGSSAQRQLAARMAVDSFDLAIHVGDVAYGTAGGTGGGSYPQLDDWVFGVYAAWLRSHPFFPSIGNHDDEVDFARPYRDVFVLPANGWSAEYPDHAERYYSFDYGPVHFVALDTELAFRDPARRRARPAVARRLFSPAAV
jgi:hypothetical protein